MKPLRTSARLTLSVVLGGVFLPACFAQFGAAPQAFEGKIEFKVQTIVQVQYYNFLVKDQRIRVDAEDPEEESPTIIIDHAFKKIFILLPRNEQYVELPDDIGASSGTHHEATGLQKTDQREKISGYSCDQFLVKTEGGEIEIWATRGLGTAGTFRTSVTDPMPGAIQWQDEILGQGYFPLLVIERDSDGDEQARFEATSFQKESLLDSMFRVPASYEKVDMSVLRSRIGSKKGKN
jgi:hypothetical protein